MTDQNHSPVEPDIRDAIISAEDKPELSSSMEVHHDVMVVEKPFEKMALHAKAHPWWTGFWFVLALGMCPLMQSAWMAAGVQHFPSCGYSTAFILAGWCFFACFKKG